ncbi:P-loop containing nucleoside triphosphate hydrolase protein [Sistotremastrum niveocremeum HHB9708]|uniref:p-loop containing nucleoside triphosphate hydrolase protein n=1 Tax=Sistotremastrum niveocremeum HHB9708 TaxID=1314777 RepID=A0A165A3D0_9AGAM|nr:P-loop containing nucleoside triphosphate hydrolase protein [Sistotremastrum niveocremeum HHB9708]
MASTDNLNDISDESYLQELIFGVDGTEDTKLRNLLASLLTSNRGEYVIRIGLQPSRLALFSDEPPEYPKDWSGVERTVDEIKSGQATVFRTADEIGAKASILFQSLQPSPGMIILLRLPPESISSVAEVRCAVIGNVDSGKSTTLGVLTRGGLDDGRGRARVSLFRHKHEIESGRTSSVGMEILGFSPEGMPVQPGTSHSSDIEVIRREKLSWDQISARSSKVVSFIDLAGHEKYLKTTLYGLTSSAPSLVVLMVGANAGVVGMSKEHLAIALALSVPIVVCITKIDMTPPNILAETVEQVTKILKSLGCRKQPVFVKSMEQAVELPEVFAQEKLCPVFQVSNVTGEGLDYIRMFLNLLPPSDGDQDKFSKDNPLEYSITEVWSVPYVGTVVNGILNAGIIKAGDPVLFGPDTIGGWTSTVVKSIQRKRAPVNSAEAGQCVSLALKRVRRSAVRKGMVIIAKTETPPKAIRHFEGQVLILYHNTTLQKNYQAMLHCGAVRQTVRITGMDNPQGILRTGDRAKVEFEFITNPEYIKVGQKLLFREGKTKGLGVVSRLL